MADMEQYPQEWRQYEPIQPRGTDWRGFFRKLWAPIAAIGAFLAKFGVVLLKFKFLLLDVRVGRLLRLARRLVVRDRARRAALRPRDGTRARGEATGPAGVRAGLHSLHGRLDLAEADAAQRLERGQARDRRADHRFRRRARALPHGGCLRLARPEGARVPRLLHQPLQPAAGGAARRGPHRRGAASGVLAGRVPRLSSAS